MKSQIPIGAISITLGAQTIAALNVLSIPVIAPTAFLDLHFSIAYIGIYIAIVYASGLFFGLASGPLTNKYGPVRTSQLALTSQCFGVALLISGHSLTLLIGSIFIGFGYGLITPAGSALLLEHTHTSNRSFLFSLKQSGVPLGGFIAGLLMPALTLMSSWRGAALGLLSITAICVFSLQTGRMHFDNQRTIGVARRLWKPISLVWRSPSLRTLSILSFLYASIQLCFVSYLVAYLTAEIGFGLYIAGFMLSIAQASGFLGRLGWGAIADRLRSSLVLLVIAMTMLLSLLLLTQLPSDAPTLIFLPIIVSLLGLSAIGWNGVFLAEVARCAPPGQVADATSGSLVFTYFGVLIAPPIFGTLIHFGVTYRTAFLLLMCPAFLGMLLSGYMLKFNTDHISNAS